MFATGVAFMYGLAIAAVIAVLLTLAASLTLLPALLSRFGARLVRPRGARTRRLGRRAAVATHRRAAGCRARSPASTRRGGDGARSVQARPWPLAIVLARGDGRAAGPGVRDAAGQQATPETTRPARSSRHAFDLLAQGFGAGFNGPLLLVAELPSARSGDGARDAAGARSAPTPDVVAVTQPRIAPSGSVAVSRPTPTPRRRRSPRPNLVNHLRDDVLPAFERQTGVTVLVGGFTAASIDFSHVLASKLPLFFGLVILLSALLLLRHLPLARDPAPGRDHEPADDRGRARRDRRWSSRTAGSRACSGCRRARSRRGCR